jgi:putative spermidine/putrescine transport system permease protein
VAQAEPTVIVGGPPRSRAARRRLPLAPLALLPFLAFTAVFLLLPTYEIAIGAFRSPVDGSYTLQNVRDLSQSQFVNAYRTSIELSVVTAVIGGVLGLLMAYAALAPGAPRFVRPVLTTFSGVAANFAGVPLAFAFVATLGNAGLLTKFLSDHFGFDLYGSGFSLFSLTGLALTYIYFQIPLMILLIMPALDGLRAEWREAAENLGATSFQFWRHVGLPVLMPSILGTVLLLFANAFSAYATAYALTSGALNLVPVLIGSVVSGDVLSNPHQGDALALGMVVIVTLTVVGYLLLDRRAARWSRR